jgi:hypothetical protein
VIHGTLEATVHAQELETAMRWTEDADGLWIAAGATLTSQPKVAVTAMGPVTVRTAGLPVTPPVQPVKTKPLSGAAFNCT